MNNNKLYTFGYGNLSLKTIIENLQKNKIQLIVDVRTHPFSRFRPEYNKKAFEITLTEAGIRYIHTPGLGAKPAHPEFYTGGKVDYNKLRKSLEYLQGIEYLERGLEFNYQIAVMCCELNYLDCHRYHLIGEDMHRRGWEVLHIDKQGSLQPHNPGL